MRVTFDGYMQTLDTTLGNRTENLQTVFEEYALALDTTLSNRAQALDIQLVERTRSLDEAFQKRLELFDDQIVRSTSAIDTAVSEKASLLSNALELHARSFRETISHQAAELDNSVMNGISAVRRTSENITRQTMKAIDGLAKQSGTLQDVAENLFSQIHGVTNRFESQGEQILKAANVLDTANLRIESTLQSRHAELSHTLDRFSGKADEFGRTLAGYSTDLEGSLSNIEVRLVPSPKNCATAPRAVRACSSPNSIALRTKPKPRAIARWPICAPVFTASRATFRESSKRCRRVFRQPPTKRVSTLPKPPLRSLASRPAYGKKRRVFLPRRARPRNPCAGRFRISCAPSNN